MAFSTLSSQQCERFGMLLWSLWRRRNVKIWDGVVEEVHQVVGRATQVLEEWQAARAVDIQSSVRHAAPASRGWTKPPLGILKCNLDAGFFKEKGMTSMGCCLRNRSG